MPELVGEVAVMESENTRLRDERMREEGRQERIAALEAENARLLAALEAVRDFDHAEQYAGYLQSADGWECAVCAPMDGSGKVATKNQVKHEPDCYGAIHDMIEATLSGDDSALKARLDAARDEGRRTAEANIYSEPNLELCRERDSLRAQLAERDDLFKEAEKSWATLARKFRDERDEAERKRDENLVQREDMQTKRKCDQLTAQVERLRDTVEDAANMLRGGKISPQILLADCDERLAETPAASLAAVREQARREALEGAAQVCEADAADLEVAFQAVTHPAAPRPSVAGVPLLRALAKRLRELATQPAKEPHDQV